MKARTTRFSYGLVVGVEILQETKTDGSGLLGVVPEVLHPVHQRALKVAFVGFAFRIVALGPPLAAAYTSSVSSGGTGLLRMCDAHEYDTCCRSLCPSIVLQHPCEARRALRYSLAV